LQGGQAQSLLDDVWSAGSDEKSIEQAISRGLPDNGMPPFGETLTSLEITGLARLILTENRKAQREGTADLGARRVPGARSSEEHSFVIETVAENLETPWAIDFLPDGRMLFTEKSGALRVVVNDVLQDQPVHGTPKVRDAGQ